jgi:hypothetical protein
MPDYTFHITEGQQVQQILLGVRTRITAFFTQKTGSAPASRSTIRSVDAGLLAPSSTSQPLTARR